MSLISKIQSNFQKIIYNNYYSRNEETDAFLNWLSENNDYNNGVFTFHKENLINDSVINVDEGDPTLKEEVASWARDKQVKQEYWNTLLDDKRLGYNNGILSIDDDTEIIINQEITLHYTEMGMYGNNYRHAIKAVINPVNDGQSITVSSPYNLRTMTESEGQVYIVFDSLSIDVNGIMFSADPVTEGNVHYTGAKVTYDSS